MMMERKVCNCTVNFLLPLYDFDYYIENNVIDFVGAYSYCPYYPYPNTITILYEVKDKVLADKIAFPDLFIKEYVIIDDEEMLLLVLNRPKQFEYEFNLILDSNFKELSWECKNKIIDSKIHKNDYKLIIESLGQFYNRTLRQNSYKADKFGTKDILNW